MAILLAQLKKISSFIYILLILFTFNLFFNLNSQWYGVSFIVRSYLFVFSFYLIFNYASLNVEDLRVRFFERFGARGELLLFLEIRIIPVALIYAITLVFTLIDYIRVPDWPANAIIRLLDGRYSNIIIYTLFLFLTLKLKKRPHISIPVFLAMCIAYFYLDTFVYSIIKSGPAIFVFKIAKLMGILFILIVEFLNIKKKYITAFTFALLFAAAAIVSVFSAFYYFYHYYPPHSFEKREASVRLLKSGFTFPFHYIQEDVRATAHFGLLHDMLDFSKRYSLPINFTDQDWERIMFSGSLRKAEFIAAHLLDKPVQLSYDRMMAFIQDRAVADGKTLLEATALTAITARQIQGHEAEFIQNILHGGRNLTNWGITVLAEQRRVKHIPLLLRFLTDVDPKISHAAYQALKKITGLDPRGKFLKINDVNTVIAFKEYYNRNRTAP